MKIAERHQLLTALAKSSSHAIAFFDPTSGFTAQSLDFLKIPNLENVWQQLKAGAKLSPSAGWSFTVTPLPGDILQIQARQPGELLFQSALSAMPDAVLILDADHRVVWCNDPELNIIGAAPPEFCPPAFLDSMNTHLAEVHESRQPVACPPAITTSDSGDQWVQARLVPIMDSEGLRFVAMFSQDVTEQMSTLRDLEVSEARNEMLLTNASEMLAVCSTSLQIRFVSDNVEEFLGLTAEAMQQINPLTIIHQDDIDTALTNLAKTIGTPDQPVLSDIRMRHADGTYRNFELRTRLLNLGEPSIVVAAREVTQQRETEALRRSLVRADKLAAIGQLAAGVAHEINNPATFIITNLYVLRDHVRQFAQIHELFQKQVLSKNPELADYFAELTGDSEFEATFADMMHMLDVNLEGMDRISLIVRELRTFSRDDPEEVQPVDLNEVASAAASMIRSHAKHVSTLQLDLQEVPKIYADQQKLTQVVVNLLMNALHAVAATEKPNTITIRTYPDDGAVYLEVEDNGVGIEANIADQIFEPFFTTKPAEDGTGLGLWLCREVATKYRGDLSFETAVGKGTTFCIQFPTAAPLSEVTGEFSLEEPSTPVSARVLMIDDDELVLDAYRHVLGKGHDLVLAHGGQAGLDALTANPDFDLIVCDVSMPRMDGTEVFAEIQNRHPGLEDKLVFCTAGATTSSTQRFLDEVSAPVVNKPITPLQLRSFIRSVIG